VRSVATRRFWTLFHALPLETQRLAEMKNNLSRRNPSHPSLHFRRLKGSTARSTVRLETIIERLALCAPEPWPGFGLAPMPRMTSLSALHNGSQRLGKFSVMRRPFARRLIRSNQRGAARIDDPDGGLVVSASNTVVPHHGGAARFQYQIAVPVPSPKRSTSPS
jgi:hypothetical protein